MGNDFHYSFATKWFDNLDKLIYYVNLKSNQSKVNLFYSTPSCYLFALNKANVTWTIKSDDFFPYAHREGAYWTGYFTSRPALKYLVKKASNYLQAFRKLNTFSINHNKNNPVFLLEKAMAQVQHHDGVSGTSQQHVTNDYVKQISAGIDASLSRLATNFKICQLNITECKPIEGKTSFSVLIFNPLASMVKHWFQFPVTHKDYEIFDDTKTKLISEIFKINAKLLKQIPERNSTSNFNIVFTAHLHPLSLKWLFFQRNKNTFFLLFFLPFLSRNDLMCRIRSSLSLKF